tara:strand:+ start:274 stop:459 length:186 start_codon:yes stop_codon:yes gene_type:complete
MDSATTERRPFVMYLFIFLYWFILGKQSSENGKQKAKKAKKDESDGANKVRFFHGWKLSGI